MANGDHQLTPSGKIKRPSIEVLCAWVINSLNLIKVEITVKSFQKTSISNLLDGTEGDALWENNSCVSDSEIVSPELGDTNKEKGESSDTNE